MIHLGRLIRACVPTVVAVALLALSTAGPAHGQVAIIAVTAALPDASEESINSALDSALESAVRGAAAMGLPRVEIHSVYVGDGYVALQVLAASQSPDAADTEGTSQRAPAPPRTNTTPYDL